MNCNEVIPLLSPFHDGEVDPGQHRAVADHVASCATCSQKLESIRRLSDLVESTPVPEAPSTLLTKVAGSLADSHFPSVSRFGLSSRRGIAILLASAAAVIGGLGIWHFAHGPSHSHEEMVRDFSEFLDAYEQGQPNAKQVLVKKYEGALVNEAEASIALKHKTVARPVVLANHQPTERYLLKMPCCKCVQTTYASNGTTSFVVFEHEKEQVEWFSARPMIHTECSGKACCLIQIKGGIAATWPVDGSFVTVVGVRDVTELERLVNELQPL